jgi:hypothetical protein
VTHGRVADLQRSRGDLSTCCANLVVADALLDDGERSSCMNHETLSVHTVH